MQRQYSVLFFARLHHYYCQHPFLFTSVYYKFYFYKLIPTDVCTVFRCVSVAILIILFSSFVVNKQPYFFCYFSILCHMYNSAHIYSKTQVRGLLFALECMRSIPPQERKLFSAVSKYVISLPKPKHRQKSNYLL